MFYFLVLGGDERCVHRVSFVTRVLQQQRNLFKQRAGKSTHMSLNRYAIISEAERLSAYNFPSRINTKAQRLYEEMWA